MSCNGKTFDVSADIQVALEATKTAIVCETPKQSQDYYDDWAKHYDSHSRVLGYTAPAVASQLLLNYVENCRTTTVLDIGTGTGLFPYHLRHTANFVGQIDVLDANMEMLHILHKKNLSIRSLTCFWLQPDGQLPFSHNMYDAVTCFGSLLPNHLPASAFKAMLNVVKPGGFLMFNVRNRYYGDVKLYNDEIQEAIDELVKVEKIQLTERKEILHMKNVDECKAILFVFKKI